MGDRQELHERIRQHSHAAAAEVKQHGRANDLIARLKSDPAFAAVDLDDTLDATRYIGRAPQQVDDFLRDVIAPLKRKYGRFATIKDEQLKV